MLTLWRRWQWNCFVNALETFFGRERLRSRPSVVQVESTSRCNLRCVQCSRQKLFGKGEDLDLDVLDRVDREALPWAREFWASFYGEPLLYPHFDRVLDIVRRHSHLRAGFFTHGLLLDEERIDGILEAGVSFLYVSIDGATRETYENIRRGASFDRLCANLETLGRKRREWESHGGRHLEVRIRVVGMRRNIEEAPSFVEMAHRYGFDGVEYYVNMTVDDETMAAQALNRFPELTNRMFALAHRRAVDLGVSTNFGAIPFPDGEERREIAPDPPTGGSGLAPDEISDESASPAPKGLWGIVRFRYGAARTLAGGSVVLGGALLVVKAIGKILNSRWGELKVAPNAYSKEHCGTPWNYVAVKTDGSIVPCCFLSTSMGNLKTQSFMEAWNGPEYRALRRSLATRRYRADCERATCNYISSAENTRYGCEWIAAPESLEAVVGEAESVRVEVRNSGTMTWRTPREDAAHWVSLGYHVLDPGGRVVSDMGHVAVDRSVAPGESVAIALALPTSLEPGDYVLRLDMVHEGITWFGDRGQHPRFVSFRVRAERKPGE
ncbi:radical SAM protein [Candidatus Sumerlaeota bacterium]|nr:radical SAM protein [Candidatus Sumerlaeota bacterium]